MQQKQKENLLISLLIIISLIAGGNIFYNQFYAQQSSVEIKTNDAASNEFRANNNQSKNLATQPEKIIVHLGGEVKNPGVYECEKYSRLYKVLNKAGGVTNKADLNKVNLAGEVRDGEKIIIPSLINDNSAAESTAKININTAQQTKLEEITGVGPVTAEKIVKYRNDNGQFKDIASLANVSGIGPKTIEKIKEKISY